jgi:hypothetical protein
MIDDDLFIVHRPVEERANMNRQSELIHVLWGYHVDRLKHGHPFGIANESISEDPDGEDRGSPLTLKANVKENGILPLDVRSSLKISERVKSVVGLISNGVCNSLWDSFSHINHLSDGVGHPLPHDPDLSELIREMNEKGESIHAFRGSRTIYSGIRVGVNTMTNLSALKYGFPLSHPLDPSQVSQALAKTTDMKLTLWNLHLGIDRIKVGQEIRNLCDNNAPLGIPTDFLRKHCDKGAIGCPSLRPIKERARGILSKHGLYEQAYAGKEHQSAIQIIAAEITRYLRQQMDDLFASPDATELTQKISPYDLNMLGKQITDIPVPGPM